MRFPRPQVAAVCLCLAATTVAFAQSTVTLDATSGTGTISTNYTTTGTGGLTLSNGFFAEYLVVGGGGSGGTAGDVGYPSEDYYQGMWGMGGGGAGGMLTGTSQISAISHAVTVGGGGPISPLNSSVSIRGNNGANSVFGSFTAVGGGGGGGGVIDNESYGGVGANGGSGGGGGNKFSNPGGSGTIGQGYPGGNARNGDKVTASQRTAGGGGGGAGGAGETPVTDTSNGGNGGVGRASTITGSSVVYAGGGGGGTHDRFQATTAGTGGSGGGGNGGVYTGSVGDGTDGLGGGGGGAGALAVGGRGGSGIVIVRYEGAPAGTGGVMTSGSGSATGYTLHTFTTTGTTTVTSALDLSSLDMNARLATTLTGTISGTGGLTFDGPGRLTLSANNTYTGRTWVRQGTLATSLANAFATATDLAVDAGGTLDRGGWSQSFANADVNGTVGNSAVGGLLTVTGTLSGSGVLNGNVLVNGVHAPGNSPGIQTFNGDLTYGSGVVVAWELAGNSTSNSSVVYDQIVFTGTSNLGFTGANVLALSFAGAGSQVDWTNAFWDVNRSWTVFDLADGMTSGFGNLSLGGSLLDSNGLALDPGSRGSFSLTQSGQDGLLQFTAVPEPTTSALALAGLAVGGVAMWRRQRSRRTKIFA